MRPIWKTFQALSILILSGMVGCGKLDTPGTSGAIQIPGTGETITDTVFSIAVGTTWEGDTNNTIIPHGICTKDSTEGDSNTGGKKPCDLITIPEAELYYGKLRLSATVNDKSKCSVLSFRPYSYRLSDQANYLGNLDCSTSRGVAGCYSGPATKLVPNFPNNSGIYYLPAVTTDLSWTVDSANSIRQASGIDPGIRWLTNELSDSFRTFSLFNTKDNSPVDYVKDSMKDYEFVCKNVTDDEKYTVKLKIGVDKGDVYNHNGLDWVNVTASSTTSTTLPIFSINVGLIWETDAGNTVNLTQNCTQPTAGATAAVPCSVSFPEAQLYYSKLRLSAKVNDKTKCSIFTFTPYGYRMSNQANFTPQGATTSFAPLDCSAASPALGCFSGPATQIVPSYPNNDSIYYLPFTNPSLNWTIDSSNTIRLGRNFNPGLRWVTNDLVDQASSQTDYVGGTMTPYRFTCEDEFADNPFTIELKIQATSGGGGADPSFNLRW